MNRTFFSLSLAAAVLAAAGLAFGQQDPGEVESPAQAFEIPAEGGDLEASDAAATAGEQAEAEEQANRRERSAPKETKIDLGESKAIRVTWTAWTLDGKDFPNVAALESGAVLAITASAPPKLWTHTDLMFGDLAVKAGNVAENYPGVYGLWLRKTNEGWSLIFNNKPDVWGTMYDAAADAGEIPLTYAVTDSTGSVFTVSLDKTEAGNVLNMTWGEHHWSAPFTYGG